jgi:hypothetical protein
MGRFCGIYDQDIMKINESEIEYETLGNLGIKGLLKLFKMDYFEILNLSLIQYMLQLCYKRVVSLVWCI